MTNLPKWLENVETKWPSFENGVEMWARETLTYQSVLHNAVPPNNYYNEGRTGTPFADILLKIQELGGKPIYRRVNTSSKTLELETVDFCFDSGFGNVHYNKHTKHISCKFCMTDFDVLGRLHDYFAQILSTDKVAEVNVIVNTDNGPQLKSLGVSGLPLEPKNYTQSTVDDFNHIVADIKSKTPCGRLSIFDGPPGTGKTYLLRHLMDACPNSKFAIVQADYVQELTGPSLISVLADQENEGNQSLDSCADSRSLVLIIEDADSCLAERGSDNLSKLSTVLNLGDGILGALLNLRIVATTNAGHIKDSADLDPALVRSGRLCRQVRVGLLPTQQANERLKELNPNSTLTFKSPTSIADVYRAAKDSSFVPVVNDKKVGF
jgi:hypothetical protein